MLRRALVAAVAFGLCGCASRPMVPSSTALDNVVIPGVVQQQGSGPWLSFAGHQAGDGRLDGSITPGSDGADWYCVNDIYRIAMDGTTTAYSMPSGTLCDETTRNPDGNVYFGWQNDGDSVDGVGQITPGGLITLFTAPDIGAQPLSMTSGSDGNIWAVGFGFGIWRVTPQGSFTVFSGGGLEIARGPDKNLWTYIPSSVGMGVYRISVADGSETQFTTSHAWGIIGGSDGNIWFGTGRAMNAMNPVTGAVTSYPLSQNVHPFNMVETFGQNFYFIDTRQSPSVLGHFSMRTHKLVKVAQLSGADFARMTVVPDGNLWLTEKFRDQVDVYVLATISPTPQSINVSISQSAPLSATERQYRGQLAAASSDSNIATVTANGKDAWTVDGVAAGSCTITVSDTRGNSVDVPVTVI